MHITIARGMDVGVVLGSWGVRELAVPPYGVWGCCVRVNFSRFGVAAANEIHDLSKQSRRLADVKLAIDRLERSPR